jgi:glycerophosphoryl diester phosphodiesterase
MRTLLPPALRGAVALLLASASLLVTTQSAQAQPAAQTVASATAPSQQATAQSKPSITKQPVSTWGIVGRKVRFVVKAKSAEHYRWQHYAKKEWAPVSGATSAALTRRVKSSTAGRYRVRVSNSTGKVYSKPVVLTSYPQTIMVGHRGDMSKSRPEQTIHAFRAASKAGAEMIEFDVRWTSDDRMILMHDATLNRTTNCTGVVEDHSYAQIRRCDAGSYRGKKYAGTKVPTFAEVLTYAHQHKLRVNAEVKTPTLTKNQAKAYLAAIKKAHMIGRAIMSTFFAADVATLRFLDPDVTVPTCWIDFGTPTVDQITASGSTYYTSLIEMFTPARVTAIHAAGVAILAGPAKTYADYRKVEALHLDGMLVNSVDKYRHWLREQV